jgi:thiosulfate/3-mercaptopyruvate sulfurtransferase
VTNTTELKKYGEAKGGHIKGAVFVPYLDLFQKDGTLKTNDEITAMFEAQGVNKTDRVVAYCTGGIRSAYVQMVLEMCGYETTFNYDQSYWNWCVDNEVE